MVVLSAIFRSPAHSESAGMLFAWATVAAGAAKSKSQVVTMMFAPESTASWAIWVVRAGSDLVSVQV